MRETFPTLSPARHHKTACLSSCSHGCLLSAAAAPVPYPRPPDTTRSANLLDPPPPPSLGASPVPTSCHEALPTWKTACSSSCSVGSLLPSGPARVPAPQGLPPLTASLPNIDAPAPYLHACSSSSSTVCTKSQYSLASVQSYLHAFSSSSSTSHTTCLLRDECGQRTL
jgi:hypothetical protein